MSNKQARASIQKSLEPAPNGRRPTIDIGPATLNVFSQLLASADISKAQIVTLLEARGLIGTGNYRLVVSSARLEPIDEP